MKASNMKSVTEFKNEWNENYGFVEMCLDDDQILSFILSRKTMRMAVDAAVDYVISQGLAAVQE